MAKTKSSKSDTKPAATKPRAKAAKSDDAMRNDAAINVLNVNGPDGIRTVIYIHGISNHPNEPELKAIWDNALFSTQMGERTRMAWWVDRGRYPEPPRDEQDSEIMARAQLGSLQVLGDPEQDPYRAASPNAMIEELTQDPDEQAWLRQFEKALNPNQSPLVDGGPGVKGLDDLAWRLGSRIITRIALPDVYDFFFKKDRRERMRAIFRDRLHNAGPCVVIAHSQGSMIAYDVLRELSAADADVRLFVTIGSPLGLPPVKARFKSWTKKSNLPWPRCVRSWCNYANRRDIVSADWTLANDVYAGPGGERVVDEQVTWTGHGAHAVRGYLGTDAVRTRVRTEVGLEFAQELPSLLVIASDLVGDYEAGLEEQRFPVLIELTAVDERMAFDLPTKASDRLTGSTPLRENFIQALKGICSADADALALQELERYVAARLTRREIECLRHDVRTLPVHRVWRNASKRALIEVSTDIVQARSAHQAYQALGQNIRWAVLDTGVDGRHPHFARHSNIKAQFNCTALGPIDWLDPKGSSDVHGHGTHVCGILAGAATVTGPANTPIELTGMAPRAELISYKVLGDNGYGEDAFIIKALDHIARTNAEAGKLVIHGVNLSLGGGFDPRVYGCGHTPICNELRRLWKQGVLVVIAAGNEGFLTLADAGGNLVQANLDLSIGDPANLEEAIAVGSVHRDRPHTYGISYFSSRGPTADGRLKPDLVAPGEKILSARRFPASMTPQQIDVLASTRDGGYVQQSGTSMAAPHVAGALAAFLSVRREFIGQPDRVKETLLAHATNLRRDPYFQGAGLLNLTRMLAVG